MKNKLIVLLMLLAISLIPSVSALTWISGPGNYTANDGTHGYIMYNQSTTTTLTLPSGVTSIDYIMAAGAGSGGYSETGYAGGAGGAAGGVRTGTITGPFADPLDIIVGEGGQARASIGQGNRGTNSTIGKSITDFVTAMWGGGGGAASAAGTSKDGSNGGSGGGATYSGGSSGTAGTGIAGQGKNGGISEANEAGGGGGGNQTAGLNGNATYSGKGGDGINTTTIWGINLNLASGECVAEGASGGAYSAGTTIPTGTCGAGHGGKPGSSATSGINGTASGGGGNAPGDAPGAGGSGFIIIRYTIPSAPVADFTINSTSGQAPHAIIANDTSTGSPTTWNYTAVVSQNSTEIILGNTRNLSYTFFYEGNYSLQLNVSNTLGYNKSPLNSHFVNVTTPLIPDFSANLTIACCNAVIQFTDLTTGTPTSWFWEFGDGNTSTLQNPTYTYPMVGNYSVNLTVAKTGVSNYTYKANYISIINPALSDFSSFNTAGTAPFTTYLYDTSTNLTPGPVTYYWDLGDGNTSTAQNLFYTWNMTGTFTVSHFVNNSQTSSWKNVTAYITVGTATVAPVASFYGGPQLGAPPLNVFFTDASSNTPTGWSWSFGDGTFSTSQNPTKWYNQSGFYTVNLTATNLAGSNVTSQTNFIMVY